MLNPAAFACFNALWKYCRRVLSAHDAKLLKTASAFRNAVHGEPIVCWVGETAIVTGHNPVRRVVGGICARTMRFGKTHHNALISSLPMFKELFYQAKLHENELGVSIVKDAPEFI